MREPRHASSFPPKWTNGTGYLTIRRRLRVPYERRDDIHEAFLAIGCSLICLKLLQARESF
jgi:hypothetical protein